MKPSSHLLIGVVLAANLTACGTVPGSIVEQPLTTRPQPSAAAPAANGAIFQAAGYRPLFEDRRARMVGDTITITINESTSAAKSAQASGSKTGSTSSGLTKLFGVSDSAISQLGVGGSTANKFEEKGAQTSSNTFAGTITVTVTEVLPNGNLLVAGEKQVALDKGTEYVRFSGIVSPQTIGAGNVVSSTQVADARIEYRTNSRIDAAEFMSQLARFFLSLAPL